MDSSRSGLLSTLLMTLPLIIVPAVALLRPPGTVGGVSTVGLDASEEDDVDAIFDEFDGFDNVSANDFGKKSDETTGSPNRGSDAESKVTDELEEAPFSAERTNAQQAAPPRINPPPSDPFMEHIAPRQAPDEHPRSVTPGDSNVPENPETAASNAETIVEQLKNSGALRTMWFKASDQAPVGFAAFFRGTTDLTRIRFEAVGQTRDECARNVLEQVTRWQQQN